MLPQVRSALTMSKARHEYHHSHVLVVQMQNGSVGPSLPGQNGPSRRRPPLRSKSVAAVVIALLATAFTLSPAIATARSSRSSQLGLSRTTRMTIGDTLIWIGFFVFMAAAWLRALMRWGEPKTGSRWWLVPAGYAELTMGLAFARAMSINSGSDKPTIGYAIGIYVAVAGVIVVTGGVVVRVLRSTPIPAFNNPWLRWPFVGVSVVIQALLAFALIITLFWAVPASLSSPPTDCRPPRCKISETAAVGCS